MLFVVKYWAGITSMSVAMIADAWHTLSDSISSIIVLLGFKISSKNKNEARPYGYGRAELIASLIVGVLLFIVSFEFLKNSFFKLMNREAAIYGNIAIIVTAASIIIKEAMAQYSFYASKVLSSRSLKADGWHHRSDAISSTVILAGIFIGDYFWWIDGALGIAVSVLLFYTSFEILKESISPLVGEKPNTDLVNKLHQMAIECYGKDMDIHHIRTHNYGDHIEITFHMIFPKNTTLKEAHNSATKLELKIYDKLNIYATIHMEPEGDIDNINY